VSAACTLSDIVKETNDLIYEGIATINSIMPTPNSANNETNDLIYEGIATFKVGRIPAYAVKRKQTT